MQIFAENFFGQYISVNIWRRYFFDRIFCKKTHIFILMYLFGETLIFETEFASVNH